MKVAVVIPFYQRTPELLAAAVASIAAQRVAPSVKVSIIVVDDGSPVSAASEPLPRLPDHCRLHIISRGNGGVAAARNTGLDAVSADTDYIAFLDSDDRWAPDHLASGLAAMAAGADFYFDNTVEEDGRSHLGYSQFLRTRHGSIDPERPVTASMDGQTAFDALLSEHIPQTSQVIYDYRHHGEVRFDETLTLASEDYLFWLNLARRSKQVAYHTGLMGWRGAGVSIHRSTYSWDSPKGIERIVDQISMRSKMIQDFDMSVQQQNIIIHNISALCDHLVFLSIRNSLRQPGTIITQLARVSSIYPQIWKRVPSSLRGLRAHHARLLAQ